MESEGVIRSATAEEIAAMRKRGELLTDWARVDAMSQEEVERLADEDEGPLSEGFERDVIVGLPLRREPVGIEADLLEWFRARGPGHEARINAVLRSFVSARRLVDAEP